MPTVFFPGIVAIRADSELVLRAISSDRLIILETLIQQLPCLEYN